MPATSQFPDQEAEILKGWAENDIFNKTLELTKNGEPFVLYEGPPYANGQPGVHHMLARSYKDAVARYKTMRGFRVRRRAGWDTHGLPVEMYVEKQLGIKSKREIEDVIGVQKFIDECRKNVFLLKTEWEEFTERMGYWLDLPNAYVTLNPEYIESCWWIFSEIEKKKRLYKDFKVVPLCTRCGTALSSHELAQGYKKVDDTAVVVKFKIKKSKGKIKEGDYILSWTTTPWTLPGNVGLAVGTEIEYVRVSVPKGRNSLGIVEYDFYIIAKKIFEELYNKDDKNSLKLGFDLVYADDKPEGMEAVKQSIENIYGYDLVELEYEPLFPGAIPETTPAYENAFKVYAADFVTTEDGTGVVHTAVMYGEDDYKLGEKVGLPKVHTVNRDGTFNEHVPQWQGWPVKHKDKPTEEKTTRAIIEDLNSRGLLLKEEVYSHDYPFCWRCDTPLLYYAKDSWFFKTTDVKKQLQAANDNINWVPEYIKKGRMGEWLANVQDWAVSRERYWGIPLPIWVCEQNNEHRKVIGGFDELKSHATSPLPEPFDPHRPGIDAILLKCEDCGGTMKRVPDVADVWFDSGSMPLAQWHYPFDAEGKKLIDTGEQYPADFIAEGIDQTRGWFYTLLAVAALLDREAPYKNVISLGMINDAQGKKMSKRLGNLVLPKELFPKYGADAVRFYLYTSSQAGDFKNFDERGIQEVIKKTMLILANVGSFYELYKSDTSASSVEESTQVLDRWVLAKLSQLIADVTADLESYDLTSAGRKIAAFVTELSTWYVRRSRDRFKSGDAAGVETLRVALNTVAKLLAPFMPFYAEQVYRQSGGKEASVHLEAWPKVKKEWKDEGVIKGMEYVRTMAESIHSNRAELGIKLRQPLSKLVIVGKSEKLRDDLMNILLQEANIITVEYKDSIQSSDNLVAMKGQNAHLDTVMTHELRVKGFIRDLVRNVNQARKEAGMTIQDRIALYIESDNDQLTQDLKSLVDQLTTDVLAERVEFSFPDSIEMSFELPFFDEAKVRVAVVRSTS